MQRKMRGSSLIDIQGKRTEQFPIGQNVKVFWIFQKSGWSMPPKTWYQAHKPEVAICAPFATANSLKSQIRQNAKSPFCKARAITEKLCASSPLAVQNDPPAKLPPEAKSP